MRKFLLLVLICFVQNTFSQSTKKNSKTKASETKNSEIPIVEVNTNNNADADLIIDEPEPSQAVVNDDDNTIYNTVAIEVKPDFPGGMEKFFKFVDNNFKYPEEAEIDDLKGKKVYATFVAEKDGSLTDIKILRDPGYGAGAETIRVLKKCPRWIPGEQNGKKIRTSYSVPITIKSN
ncbi:energy transducer TonB [uncultured Flavobacterium sp.]|uniref:energy transducer TonB n=1 Tax=uncultured Flavobacterium sp. TaxID=165435 RepID=UPI0029314D66|nr:energy transducer TonB [uncultured Flavobacterium sp.]